MAYSIRKSVFIGIGGAGTSAVRSAKKTVLETYGKLPPFLRFIAIDSDSQNDNVSLKLDPGREFLHLTIAKTMEARESQPLLKETYPLKNVKSLASKISSGCGQIRGNGRLTLLFENNYHSVVNFLKNSFIEINRATDNIEFEAPDTPLDVYIISSLAGGTGSGMISDIAIIVNQILTEDNIHYTPPTALLLLPDLYRNKPFTRNIHGNAYAALKEIDFIMDGNVKDVQYPDKRVRVDFALFSKIGVIDNLRVTSSGLLALPNNENVERAIGKALVVLSGSMGTNTASVWDNAQGQISTRVCEGKKQFFSGVGICELVFNTDKLINHLLLKTIVKIIEKSKEGAAYKYDDVLNILKGWKVREDRKDNQNQVIDRILVMTTIPEPESLEKSDLSKEMISRLDSIRTNYINTLKNKAIRDADLAYTALQQDFQQKLNTFHIDEIHKVGGLIRLKSLYLTLKGYAVACQLEMTEEIGTATSADFRDPFNRKLERVKAQFTETAASISEEISSWITSRKDLTRLGDEYRDLIKQELICELEIIRRDRVHNFYIDMERLAQKNLESLIIIESRLSDLYSDTVRDITSLVNSYEGFNEFGLDLGKRYLDNQVTQPNDATIFNDFATYLYSNNLIDSTGIHTWAQSEPDKIRGVFNDFLNHTPALVNSIREITIDTAFRNLPAPEKEEIIRSMKDFATPMWNPDRNPSGFNPEIIAFFGVPNALETAVNDRGDGEITWLDKLKPKSSRLDLVSTNDKKRYIYITIEAAGPAFTIGKIRNYRTKFTDSAMTIEFLSNQVWKNEMDALGFDLIPIKKDEEAVQNWALGCVFDLIKRDSTISRNYVIFSSKASATDNGWYNLKTLFRDEAFRIYVNDEMLKKDIKEQLSALWQQKGAEACLAEIREYLNAESPKGYLKKLGLQKKTLDMDTYAGTKKQMDDELNMLKKYLSQ